MTRGQMELLGIAIVVILAVLGLFFFLTLSASNNDDNLLEDFRYQQVPARFVTTIPDISTSCPASFVELIQDCSISSTITPFSVRGTYYDGCGYSCPYVNDSFTEMLDKSLENMGVKYSFVVYHSNIDDDNNIIFQYGDYTNCNRETLNQGKTGIQQLNYNQYLFLVMRICA